MNRSYRIGFVLALLVALAPAGVRLTVWPRSRPVAVDADMARAGEVLFKRDWTARDSLCPDGDGLGPVFNASSCVACHNQGGPGGGGGLEHNVTGFTIRGADQKPIREGVLHARGVERRETLRDLNPSLPPISQPTLEQVRDTRSAGSLHRSSELHLSQRNTPALFGAQLIDAIPEAVILAGAKRQQLRWGMARSKNEGAPVGRVVRLANGKVGKFGWKAQMASLSDFVRAACANELGLSNPDHMQPTPLYAKSPPRSVILDLTARQCDELTAFCASLPRPVERLPKDVSAAQAEAGKALFTSVGCIECHTANLGSVDGLYSDLLLHHMGHDLVGGGSYGDPPVPVPSSPDEKVAPSEWRTPPLWGVADSAPYLHDGRAGTLEEAIQQHGGQGRQSAQNYAALSTGAKTQLLGFLKSLRAP